MQKFLLQFSRSTEAREIKIPRAPLEHCSAKRIRYDIINGPFKYITRGRERETEICSNEVPNKFVDSRINNNGNVENNTHKKEHPDKIPAVVVKCLQSDDAPLSGNAVAL